MTWREYCDHCGFSFGGINSKQMAQHLKRIHNRSGSCPVEGAQIEEESDDKLPTKRRHDQHDAN